jgi:hypothetical protein
MYHVGRNGQQTGPFSIEQLKTMAANGELQPTDLVWKEGMAGWEPASTLPGVFTPGPGPEPSAMEMPQANPVPLAQATVLPPVPGPGGPKPNPLALTGMILGIVSIVLVCCCYGFPFNVAGIVCSIMGMNQIKATGGQQPGMGMAQAGLWCSIASLVIGILFAIFGVAMNSWQQFAPK